MTVNKYGEMDADGKLCLAGTGSAENVMLAVAGASWVDLNSNAVKTLAVAAAVDLSQGVQKFDAATGMSAGPSETLEVGGSVAAGHDVALLGIVTVIVSGRTADSNADTEGHEASVVTLKNMADGMGITARGEMGVAKEVEEVTQDFRIIDARINHQLAGDERTRHSGELDVHLIAVGGGDTESGVTGETVLQPTPDREIEVLNVDSSAMAGGSASAGVYENALRVKGANIEEIHISGDAKLRIRSEDIFDDLVGVEFVDARDNTGGVDFGVFSLASATAEIEFLGSEANDRFFMESTGTAVFRGNGGDDHLLGGSGDDTFHGGAGMDILLALSGDNVFEYSSASESTLTFDADGKAQSHDLIQDWNAGAGDNTISLGKTLFNSLSGVIKTSTLDDDDGTTLVGGGLLYTFTVGAGGLKAFYEKHRDGFFETFTPATSGFGGTTNRHSVAVVTGDRVGKNDPRLTPGDSITWIFIDVDGDGDFDLGSDMAITLIGNAFGDAVTPSYITTDTFTI